MTAKFQEQNLGAVIDRYSGEKFRPVGSLIRRHSLGSSRNVRIGGQVCGAAQSGKGIQDYGSGNDEDDGEAWQGGQGQLIETGGQGSIFTLRQNN